MVPMAFFSSCKEKPSKDQEFVDSLLAELDTVSVDTLVYHVEEEPLSEAVDENFNDFFYTFTHNKSFCISRVNFPLSVTNEDNQKIRVIKNRNDFKTEFSYTDNDYYVLLLNSKDDLDVSLGADISEAGVHVVDLQSQHVRMFGYGRKDGKWNLSSEQELSFSAHPCGEFLEFYDKFSQDSVFQLAHIAQPLEISIPDEDDGEMIEGTIDADQFPVFSPELPSGQFLMMNNGSSLNCFNPQRVVMVKCGMASGMMNILVFEKEEDSWKLVELSE